MSRRDLLRTAGGAVLVAAGCDLSTDPSTADPGADGEPKAKGKESPMLAAQVEAGDLPPVAERLPTNPVVVEPAERIGVYGGEWNSAMAGRGDSVWLRRTIGYEQLLNWDVEFTEPVPNIVEAVEPEDDGRVYTLRLREGLRWSDGEPFTADDIMFWYEDVVGNEDIGGFPSALTVGGAPPTVERVDDYTVRFVYPEPYGLFLQRLATVPGRGPTESPRHYLEQFHQAYNSDVDALVEQEGLDDWAQLFLAKAHPWSNPELPTLKAWRITTPLGEGSRVVAERNPYYFKTDPDGSQLPYLDRVVYEVVTDEEVILLKATNGELNMHVEEPPEAARRQMELYDQLQQTLDDAAKRELFREILRIAKDEFYCIGTVLPDGDYGIVGSDFHNVPEPMIMSWMYPTPGPTQPEQYFIEE